MPVEESGGHIIGQPPAQPVGDSRPADEAPEARGADGQTATALVPPASRFPGQVHPRLVTSRSSHDPGLWESPHLELTYRAAWPHWGQGAPLLGRACPPCEAAPEMGHLQRGHRLAVQGPCSACIPRAALGCLGLAVVRRWQGPEWLAVSACRGTSLSLASSHTPAPAEWDVSTSLLSSVQRGGPT